MCVCVCVCECAMCECEVCVGIQKIKSSPAWVQEMTNVVRVVFVASKVFCDSYKDRTSATTSIIMKCI